MQIYEIKDYLYSLQAEKGGKLEKEYMDRAVDKLISNGVNMDNFISKLESKPSDVFSIYTLLCETALSFYRMSKFSEEYFKEPTNLECGVDENGGVVFWTKNKPESITKFRYI